MEFMYSSPLGDFLITYDDKHILGARFDQTQTQTYVSNAVISACIKQLDLYFAGKLQKFDLPLNPAGTDFQKLVWAALQDIPYGQTRSYGDIAKTIGKPAASRAVGGANNKNPIYIIIPCHRVVGANGALTGYGGGINRKVSLLELEKQS